MIELYYWINVYFDNLNENRKRKRMREWEREREKGRIEDREKRKLT